MARMHRGVVLIDQNDGTLAVMTVQKNEQLTRENLAIRIEIERLKHDLDYIENIARQEFGMIRKDEIILKPKKQSDGQK